MQPATNLIKLKRTLKAPTVTVGQEVGLNLDRAVSDSRAEVRVETADMAAIDLEDAAEVVVEVGVGVGVIPAVGKDSEIPARPIETGIDIETKIITDMTEGTLETTNAMIDIRHRPDRIITKNLVQLRPTQTRVEMT